MVPDNPIIPFYSAMIDVVDNAVEIAYKGTVWMEVFVVKSTQVYDADILPESIERLKRV